MDQCHTLFLLNHLEPLFRSMQRVDEEKINYDLIEDVLLLLLVNRNQCTFEAPEGADLSRGSILGKGQTTSVSSMQKGIPIMI